MEQLKEEKINKNGSRKITMSVRCYAELKLALEKEAGELGITLSEHIETLLLNRGGLHIGIENALKEIGLYKKQLIDSNAQFISSNSRLENRIREVEAENQNLEALLDANKKFMAIFNDPHLLKLFTEVKDWQDTIELEGGEKFTLTYNHPYNLLLAMIYSYKLENSRTWF